MPNFRHGPETIQKTVGTEQISEVKTAVIFIVGTAPTHLVASGAAPLNQLVMVRSDADYAQFGPDVAGYSIPEALKAHGLLKAGLVFVCNVFNPAKTEHKTTVAEATLAVVDNVITLAHKDIISATVKHIASPDVLAVEGDDYTLDRENGIITFTEDGILDGDATAKVALVKGNPAGVTSADVIGTTNSSGVRSGMQTAYDTENRYGFLPKIFIAPRFSSAATVMSALASVASKCRGVWYADAPAGTTGDDALTGRTPGETPDLSSVHKRGRICIPHFKRDDGRVVPMSPYVAVLRAWSDKTFGYWFSISNQPVQGVSGAEIPIDASFTDENAMTNLLNAAGLTTIFCKSGLGVRVWGNRMVSFPGDTGIETFEPVLVTRDVIEESIEYYAALRRVDKPTSKVLIDQVLDDVNGFLNELIGKGASMPGSVCWVDPAQNPSQNLAAGKIKWSYKFCPPPPAENPQFESILDTTLLGNVFA